MSETSLRSLRAVAYCRRSTTRQEASLQEQRSWIDRAVAERGISLLATFEDDGIAGSEIEERPGLMRMVRFCEDQPKKAPVGIIVLWDADRLSRANVIRTMAVIDRMKESGVRYLLTNEGTLDLDSDIDLILFTIQQQFGRAGYAKAIAKTVTRNGIERAKEGLWVAGKPPYGYEIGDSGKLVIQQPQGGVVRWIYERIVDHGDSLGDLCRTLKERGIAGPGRSKAWRRDTLSRLLRNPAYLGHIVWGKVHQGKYYRIAGGRPERAHNRERRSWETTADADRVILKDAHPALIDEATFEKANRALRDRRWKRTTPLPAGGEWLLSGLVHCGDCGGRMTGRTEYHRRKGAAYTYRRYFCTSVLRYGRGSCRTSSILQDTLLSAVAKELKAAFEDTGRYADLAAEVEARSGAVAEQQARDIGTIERRLAELETLIAQGNRHLIHLPADRHPGVIAELRKLETEFADLSESRRLLLEAGQQRSQETGRIAGALRNLAQLTDRIKEAPPAVVRRVVSLLVKKATVIFDHSLPHNRSHAVAVELEFTPEASEYLLPSGARRQQVCIIVRVDLPSGKKAEKTHKR